MMHWKLYTAIFFLVIRASALSCPTLYDYSSGAVKCVTSCPANTTQVQNSCCSKAQYFSAGGCRACNGWVLNGSKACCHYGITFLTKLGEYYSNFYSECRTCPGQTFLGGMRCCSGCEYLDMTGDTPLCMAVGSGGGFTLNCTSLQKVYCANDEYLYLPEGKCVPQTGRSCDQVRKMCCPTGQYIDFVNMQFACVSTCRYGVRADKIVCADKYCTPTGKAVLSRYGRRSSLLLAYSNGQCCAAIDESGQCLTALDNCAVRFRSNMFPICCPDGKFYNVASKKCESTCEGIVSVGVFCIASGSLITFQENNVTALPDRVCNGVTLPTDMTICCPVGSYVNGVKGCVVCNGRIFGTTDSQVCCRLDEVYNPANTSCSRCNGPIDSYGLLCCQLGQYVSYNEDGSRTCQSSCSLDFVQSGSFCCKICNGTNIQCNSRKVSCGIPSGCSPSFFVASSCQPCACGNCLNDQLNNYCKDCQASTTDRLTNCLPGCSYRSVYDSVSKICLDCDQSCDACKTPLDSGSCLSCRKGYSTTGATCQACDINCEQCQGAACVSCFRKGMYPVLSGGRCMPSCRVGSFVDINATCTACDAGCFTCSSTTSQSCLSCYNGSYISAGRCQPCSPSCKNCDSSPQNCTQCSEGMSLWNGSCSSTCRQNTIQRKVGGESRCISCHPDCLGCKLFPINCLTCRANFYSDNSTGFNICVACPSSCPNCTGKNQCGTCSKGFFKGDDGGCSKCDPSCETCTNGLASGCSTCPVGLQLNSGICSGCLSSCATCSSPTTCSSCSASKFLVNGSCLDSCPDKSFMKGTECKACDSTCLTCTNETKEGCVTCADSFPYKDENVCVAACNKTSFILNRQCYLCKGTVFMLSTLCCLAPKIVVGSDCIPPRNDTNYNNNTNNNNTHNNTNNNTNNNSVTPPNNTYPNGTVFVPQLKAHCILRGNSMYITIVNSNQSALNKNNLGLELLREIKKRLLLQSTSLNYTVIHEGKDYITVKADSPTVDSSNPNAVLKISYPPYVTYSPALATQYMLAGPYREYRGLKTIGIICSIVLLIYGVMCKCKNHYEAEQANRLVLHSLHFCQIVGMFYTAYLCPDGRLFNFYKGFRFSHFSWLFNMFAGTLPIDYIEPYQPATLIPDGNLTRNAGFSFSMWIVLVLLLVLAIATVYIIFYCDVSYPEPPAVRLILRLFIFFMGLTFLNITYYSVVELLYHSSDGYYPHQSVYLANFGCSIAMLLLIPLMIAGAYVHQHFTYFSDQLEHLYSMRECSQLMLNFFQAIVLAVSIDQYLTVLLLVFELLWFGWNILLYPVEHWSDNLKHYITEAAIVLGYIMLIVGKLASIGTIVLVTLVMVVLIVYCTYQVVGLYYWNIMAIFGIYEEDQLEQPIPSAK